MLCLAGPLVLFDRAPWDGTLERRAQAPSPMPPQSLADAPAWTTRIDAWARDRFGWRSTLLTARAAIQLRLFNTAVAPSVKIGLDDWLFYLPKDAMEDLTGRRAPDPALLDAWADALLARRAAAKRAGAAYIFLFVPNKERIYPDKLPADLQHRRSRTLDRLRARLADRLGNGKLPDWIIEPTESFRSARDTFLLYNPIDVHWNAAGAYTAYLNLVPPLGTARPGFTPTFLPRAAFRAVETDWGDLAAMATRTKSWVRKVPDVILAAPLQCQEAYAPAPVEWPAPAVVKPQTAYDCPGHAGRAVIFGDSMMLGLTPFLAASLGHARLVDQYPDEGMIEDFARAEHADLVIDEVVERQVLLPPLRATPLAPADNAPPPPGAGGFLAATVSNDASVMVEGWAFVQDKIPGARIVVRTERAETAIVHGNQERRDVVASEKDDRLARSGILLRFTPNPGRLCVWSEDPVYGARRLRFVNHPELNLCP